MSATGEVSAEPFTAAQWVAASSLDHLLAWIKS